MENQIETNTSISNLSDVLRVAKFQKYLLLLVLAGFLTITYSNLILSMVISIFSMYFVYEIGLGLKLKNVRLWVFSMFIPFVSLVIMLIINDKATKFIKASGFRVGLLGADVNEIRAKVNRGDSSAL